MLVRSPDLPGNALARGGFRLLRAGRSGDDETGSHGERRDGHHGYTPANGIPALREAVAADLEKRHNVSVNPDNVVVVPGGKPTMFFAILMFGEPGAEIMYPNPGFPISYEREEC